MSTSLDTLLNNVQDACIEYKEDGASFDEDDLRDVLDTLTTEALLLCEKVNELLA